MSFFGGGNHIPANVLACCIPCAFFLDIAWLLSYASCFQSNFVDKDQWNVPLVKQSRDFVRWLFHDVKKTPQEWFVQTPTGRRCTVNLMAMNWMIIQYCIGLVEVWFSLIHILISLGTRQARQETNLTLQEKYRNYRNYIDLFQVLVSSKSWIPGFLAVQPWDSDFVPWIHEIISFLSTPGATSGLHIPFYHHCLLKSS